MNNNIKILRSEKFNFAILFIKFQLLKSNKNTITYSVINEDKTRKGHFNVAITTINQKALHPLKHILTYKV